MQLVRTPLKVLMTVLITTSHEPPSSRPFLSRLFLEPGLAEVRGESHQRRLPDDQATRHSVDKAQFAIGAQLPVWWIAKL